jgi:hypothetical protein
MTPALICARRVAWASENPCRIRRRAPAASSVRRPRRRYLRAGPRLLFFLEASRRFPRWLLRGNGRSERFLFFLAPFRWWDLRLRSFDLRTLDLRDLRFIGPPSFVVPIALNDYAQQTAVWPVAVLVDVDRHE